MPNDEQVGNLIRERFAKLPKVVQDAITSVDVSNQMRALAKTHNLHIDQWDRLENEVHLALLGIQPLERLPKNLVNEVGVDETTAHALASDISRIVFEPIREELERQLEHPDATAEKTSVVEDVRTRILEKSAGEAIRSAPEETSGSDLSNLSAPPLPTPVPSTAPAPAQPAHEFPPPPAAAPAPAEPQKKVERTPAVSAAYAPKVASHERKTVEGDPYREQIG